MEEEGWEDEEEEGWEDERRSWELGAEEAQSGADREESDRHCDRSGVFALLPSGTSTPSFSSTSEPSGDNQYINPLTNRPINQRYLVQKYWQLAKTVIMIWRYVIKMIKI